MVWPGPPWVRRDGAGPLRAGVRFKTPDKTAWDIEPWQLRTSVPLGRLVFLEPPGGEEVVKVAVDRARAISQIIGATIWLIEPERRAAATFEGAARVASGVDSVRLRLPREDDWFERAERALRA